MNQKENNLSVPIWEKYALTIAEAARYFSIGENRIRELIKEPGCMYVLYVGKKALIKRKEFEKELNVTTYVQKGYSAYGMIIYVSNHMC